MAVEVDGINSEQMENITDVLCLPFDEWKQINRSLERFIRFGEDPKRVPNIRQTIVDSWIRSREFGIEPTVDISAKKIEPSLFNKILKDNEQFIQIATSILKKELSFICNNSNFSAGIADCNGVTLTSLTDWPISDLKQPGLDLSEQSIGTSSHSLSAYLDKPVLLIAPENYNTTLQNISVASSVPIHDAKGKILGIFSLGYCCDWKQSNINENLFRWMLAHQYALARKVEYALCNLNYSFHINIGSRLIDDIMSRIEEGLITINTQGKINHITESAANILGVTVYEAKQKKLTDIVGESEFITNLETTQPIHNLGFCSNDNKDYSLKIISVQKNEGALISLSKQTPKSNDNSRFLNALYTFSDILGERPELIKAKTMAKKIAPSNCNVLLIGESGTGKEMFAHAIHNAYRPQKPFVAINCASIPKGLIESELFGYESGSFTGADKKGRIGKIELAQGGTVFFDEIGDMPLELQPVLLRVLEDKRLMRIGSNKFIPVDFRVIAATNKNLHQMVQDKLFREDLYFRLSTFKITLPPLRDSEIDIINLAQRFIQKAARQFGKPIIEIEPAFFKKIVKYHWPGNARELQNAMYFAVNMADNGIIKMTDLPEEVRLFSSSNDDYIVPRTIQELEKQAIEDAMKCTNNNIGEAAVILGIGRTTLYRKLKLYKLG